MSRVIEAKAVISAADQTGKVFDNVAKKIQGVSKAADAFKNMKPFEKSGWGQDFTKQIDSMKLTSRELDALHKSWSNFNAGIFNGTPVAASKAIDAMNGWKRQTLANLREVKAATEATEVSHLRYLRNVGKYAIGAIGVGVGAHEVGRGLRAGVRTAAEQQRELVRMDLAGFSKEERNAAVRKSNEISTKLPDIGRAEVVQHLRLLTGRLGTFEHAMETVDDVAKAEHVLKSLTGGERAGPDLEQLIMGLETKGLGADPAGFRRYLNAFVRAKSLFPDLRGEDFRQYMQTAKTSKYGVSENYLTEVVPTMMQHEGATQFGTMQRTFFQAMVGGRMTKQARASLGKYGLMNGRQVIEEQQLVADPYQWALKYVQPRMAKAGIPLDEEHKGDLVSAITKMFSAPNAGEFLTSLLLNRGVIEKDRLRLRKASGIEAADQPNRDPFVAWEAATKQMKEAAAAFMGLQPVIDGLNALANRFSKFTTDFKEGDNAEKAADVALMGAGGLGAVLTTAYGVRFWRDFTNRRGRWAPKGSMLETGGARGLSGGFVEKVLPKVVRLLRLAGPIGAAVSTYDLAGDTQTGDPALDEARRKRIEEQMHEWNKTHDFTLGSNGGFSFGGTPVSGGLRRSILQPGEHGIPAPSEFNYNPVPVSVLVGGEVQGKFEVTASSELLRMVDSVKTMSIKLQQANGPGSNGRTSPDASPGAGGRLGHI